MTQALNLGLLGNNVNASGQLSLTAGVSGTLPVANGGIGAATLAANNVLLGNGTSTLQTVAPSTSGNVLTSNGSTWTSAAPPAVAPTTAQVLNATAGASAGAVGSYMWGGRGSANSFGTTAAGSQITPAGGGTFCSGTAFVLSGSTQAGTWRCMGYNSGENNRTGTLWLRIS